MKFQEIIFRASLGIIGIGLGFIIVNAGYTPSDRIAILIFFIGLLLNIYANNSKKKNDNK
jgi:hypothetical protein